LKAAPKGKRYKAHIFASGPLLREALRAQDILAEQFDVSADVWSATSYKLLRGDALRIKRWNMLHPTAPRKQSYLESVLQNEEGVFVAVSDYMKIVPDQIAPWVPGGLTTMGTDGFGRSDTRPNLRRFFEVDAESTAIATLYALYQKGSLPAQTVDAAIRKLGIDPDKASPFYL
jgi:pyruvate dehydrogenase E1 component